MGRFGGCGPRGTLLRTLEPHGAALPCSVGGSTISLRPIRCLSSGTWLMSPMTRSLLTSLSRASITLSSSPGSSEPKPSSRKNSSSGLCPLSWMCSDSARARESDERPPARERRDRPLDAAVGVVPDDEPGFVAQFQRVSVLRHHPQRLRGLQSDVTEPLLRDVVDESVPPKEAFQLIEKTLPVVEPFFSARSFSHFSCLASVFRARPSPPRDGRRLPLFRRLSACICRLRGPIPLR